MNRDKSVKINRNQVDNKMNHSIKIMLWAIISVVTVYTIYYGYQTFRNRDKSSYAVEVISSWQKSKQWENLYRDAVDTCMSWVNNDSTLYNLKDNTCLWKLDSLVAFNEDKTRVLLFLYVIGTEKDDMNDVAHIFSAEFKNECWEITTKGFPSIVFGRQHLNNGQAYTFFQLQHLTIKEIANGGYINWLTTKPNYKYVDQMIDLHKYGKRPDD